MYKYNYTNGEKMGELIFIGRIPSVSKVNREPKANFKCSCGKEFISQIRLAKNGRVKSCGCKRYELASQKNRKHLPTEYLDNGVKRIPFLRESDIRRFWSKVIVTENINDCWYWNGANNKRYGLFTIGKGSSYKSNRLAYFIHYKQDPEDKLVLHSCHNSMCCNPAHLSLGTHMDNMQDMVEAGRGNNQFTKNIANKLK